MVEVKKVFNPGGLGGYLGKYLSKGFDERGALSGMGFRRRWSCSRNWPRETRIVCEGTRSEVWRNTKIVKRWNNREALEAAVKRDADSPLLRRVGDDLGEILRKRSRTNSGIAKIERMERAFI